MRRITVFRNVTPCSLVGECRCFGRIYCFHLRYRWETFGFSESLVLIYQTVQRHFWKKRDFNTGHLKEKFCLLFFVVLHNMGLHFFLQFTFSKPQNSKALVLFRLSYTLVCHLNPSPLFYSLSWVLSFNHKDQRKRRWRWPCLVKELE